MTGSVCGGCLPVTMPGPRKGEWAEWFPSQSNLTADRHLICSDKTGTLTRNEMSVQALVVVLPSVSTAGRWRIMARRAAIRRTPTARAIVMIAGSPSGIAATAKVTAASAAPPEGYPRSSPTPKIVAAANRIASVRSLLNRAILRVRGVSICVVSCNRVEMRPSSVLLAVSITTPLPIPETT